MPTVTASSREALIAAAKDLLWERGYESTSPRAVLERSGVGQGSLYHHFRGKQDLAHAALESVSTDLVAMTGRLFDPALPPLDRVRGWLAVPRDGLKGCRLGRLASEQAVFDAAIHAPIAAYFTALEGAVAGALQEAQTAGAVPADVDIKAVAMALIAVVQGGYVMSRVQGDKTVILRATQGAAALLDAALVR